MKFISSILAILLLVLSCIPCSDTGLECHGSINIAQQNPPEHPKSSDQEHQDLCSPFCQCSCCAVAYTIPFFEEQVFQSSKTFPTKSFAAYLQQKPIGIAIPVWQPPKSDI